MPAVDGIVSGLDTTSLIRAIVDVAAAPKVQIEKQLGKVEANLEKVTELSGRLQSLADAMSELDEANEFDASKASLSDETSLTATTGPEAAAGTYSINVQALARNEVEQSQGFADPDANVLGTGTFQITVAGTSTDITLDGTNNTLEGLAEALNGVDGVTAYVLDTGVATDPYTLVVQGETGAANTLSFDGSGLSGGTVPAFTQVQGAQDAHVNVNGIDVYSATNQVTALPGVTLNLTQETASPVDLTITRDVEAITAQIQAVVDAYNDVRSYYGAQTSYNQEVGIAGGLVGDGTVRQVMDRLAEVMSKPYSTSGAYENLSQAGIETQQNGKLELNTDKLAAALETNFDDVLALFTDEAGPIHNVRDTIENTFVDENEGTLSLRSESLEETIEDFNERIEHYDKYLASYSDRLRSQFNSLELVMAEMQSTSSYLSAILPSSSLISSS